jgi:hypothetical protein
MIRLSFQKATAVKFSIEPFFVCDWEAGFIVGPIDSRRTSFDCAGENIYFQELESQFTVFGKKGECEAAVKT